MDDREDVYAEVVRKLRAAARTNRVVEAAQVHLINLQEVIRRAGKHWPHVRERIRAGSMNFLRGCVDEDDIIIPCGDGFLVIFARGEQAELAARCANIQELLTAFYTGEEGLERLSARVRAQPLEQGSFEALLNAPEAQSEPQDASRECGEHQIVFTPLWSARAELIAAHLCQPSYCDAGVVRTGYNRDYRQCGSHQQEDYAALDAEILHVALTTLQQLVETGRRGFIGATVHSSTLRQLRTRMAYFSKLAAAPPALTQRLLLRVAEIEVGAPPFTLADSMGFLRAHARRVALEHHHLDRNVDRLGEIGAWAAGFQLPPHRPCGDDATLRIMREQIALWGRELRRQRLRLAIDNFRSAGLLHAARDAGLELTASEAFWPSAAMVGAVAQAPIPPDESAPARA